MRATLETDNHYKFVFFTQYGSGEMVRCFYPDGERETVTLDYFLRALRNEQKKRSDVLKEIRAYRKRNKKPMLKRTDALAKNCDGPTLVEKTEGESSRQPRRTKVDS